MDKTNETVKFVRVTILKALKFACQFSAKGTDMSVKLEEAYLEREFLDDVEVLARGHLGDCIRYQLVIQQIKNRMENPPIFQFNPPVVQTRFNKSSIEIANYLRKQVLEGISLSIETMCVSQTVSRELGIVFGNIKFLEALRDEIRPLLADNKNFVKSNLYKGVSITLKNSENSFPQHKKTIKRGKF